MGNPLGRWFNSILNLELALESSLWGSKATKTGAAGWGAGTVAGGGAVAVGGLVAGGGAGLVAEGETLEVTADLLADLDVAAAGLAGEGLAMATGSLLDDTAC